MPEMIRVTIYQLFGASAYYDQHQDISKVQKVGVVVYNQK